MAGLQRSQTEPPTLNSILPNASFTPHSFLLPPPHPHSGSCFCPSLHLVKNLTLLGENRG